MKIRIESGSNTIRKRINKLGDISSVIAVIREKDVANRRKTDRRVCPV